MTLQMESEMHKKHVIDTWLQQEEERKKVSNSKYSILPKILCALNLVIKGHLHVPSPSPSPSQSPTNLH